MSRGTEDELAGERERTCPAVNISVTLRNAVYRQPIAVKKDSSFFDIYLHNTQHATRKARVKRSGQELDATDTAAEEKPTARL